MQKVTDEDLIKQCNAAIGAEPSMYNQNIIPHLHRYFITGYRVCEQDAAEVNKDKNTVWYEIDKYEALKKGGCVPATIHFNNDKLVWLSPSPPDAGKEQEAVDNWWDTVIAMVQDKEYHDVKSQLKMLFHLTKK